MKTQTLILRVSLGILIIGGIGFAATTLIHFVAPKEGVEAELTQTKKMLREGFDRNKELVKENQELNDRLNRLLQEGQEKDKETESLGRQLEDQVKKVRDVIYGSRDSASGRLFGARHRQFQRLVAMSRNKTAELSAQLEEQEKFIKKLEEQMDIQVAELESIHAGTTSEMGSFKKELKASLDSLKAKDEKIAALEKKLKTSPALISLTSSSENEVELRRQIAKQYLGTIEDLLGRIEELKAGKPGEEVVPRVVKAEASSSPSVTLPVVENSGKAAKLQRELEKERGLRNKDRLTFFFNLGVIYTQYNLYREAADIFEKALKIDPNDAGVHYNLGILYDEHLNDKEKAKMHYESYLRLDPDGIKRSDVEKWLYMARRYGGKHDDGRSRSARGAIEQMFLTNAAGT